MRKGITRAIWLVALAFLVLTFSSFMDLVLGSSPGRIDKGLLRKVSRQQSKGPAVIDREAYASIASGVFLGTVKPAPQRGRRRTPARRSGPMFTLRGTLIHSDPSRSCAFIEVRGEADQRTLHVGDRIQGAEVREITAEAVELVKGSQTIRLKVNFEDLPPRGFEGGGSGSSAAGPPPPEVARLLEQYPQAKPLWEAATDRERSTIQRVLKLPEERRNRFLRGVLQRIARRVKSGRTPKANGRQPNSRQGNGGQPNGRKKDKPKKKAPAKNRLRF